VISLASLRPFDARAVRLLEEVWSTLTARMNGVLGHQQVRDLAARLEGQNRELETQKQELAAQADELIEMNTELEMQKRQVDEANRLKSVFLSNMSHELRTPLNSVIVLSGVLNRRLGRTLPKEERGYLDVIERNGKHLLALINDILHLSRIEADRQELNPARFSVRTLAGEVVAMIEPQAREKNITLTNLVGDDLPLVYSDPDKCQHILQNLVGNAVKFTEAGTVEVSARHVDDEIHVAIRDTGIGIAADQLPHIFDEFRQTDAGVSRKYGGTGLGLAIAKKYAELLHGGITVESAPGSGSTFTLRLPVTLYPYSDGADEAAPPGDSPGVTVAGPSAVGQGQRILLVEDNEPAVTQISEILTGQGYRVHVTRNGKEALQQIEQAPPDAVILDLMMPEMDGFEVLKAIRGSEKTAHLPVLILTAKHVSREELSFLKGNHVHQLIQKGDVSRTELLAAIERMVAPRETPAPRRRRLDRKRPPGQAVILVVEDNPDNLRTMRALLQGTYTLLEATDGWAAVEQARRYAPDLILMDIALPVIDGFAVLAAIREDVALRNTAVVAVTASAMKGDREDILARGFDGYISKPVDEKLLLETIRGMLYGD
jgi:signal transduction histidine kinase/DNA-binding response OmpR family regulator